MINTELHNGDCLEYMKKIPTSSIDLIITDPPYNLGKFMEERDTNLVKMRDNFFGAAGWDDLDYKEWKKSMNKFFHQASRVLKDGGSIIVFMAIIKVETIIQLAQKHGLYYKTTGIWHKSNPMPRNMNLHFVNSTESWIYFTYKTKTGTFNNNGKVLHDFIETSVTSNSEKKYGKHPTQKPEALMEHFVKVLSNENDTILDPFMGSGSVGVSAVKNNRNFIGIELDENYFNVEGQKATPISDRVLNRPTSVSGLTKEEAKQLATEIKSYKKEGKQYQKDKEAVEARYKYDVRILNVLATTGLKASSIAHEMKNDRNAIYDNYNNIVDALKEYGMWDELNSSEKTRKSYKNVPYLLESNDVVGKKLVTFMDTMLEEIEKKQFEIRYQSIADILTVIKKVWERDYAWLSIEIIMDEDIVYQISEDILQVIFDNLILNSVQQNENTQKLMITISINETNGFLNIKYCDNGKGLNDKYKTDPMKILEVHETTRTNGHGLGMWIVNNTCTMSGGEIQKICGEKGFEIEFTIGGKI